MTNKRQIVPVTGLLVTIAFAGYMVARLSGQSESRGADFTNATSATVLDAQGQVILTGQFQPAEEDDDDVERRAVLAPVASGSSASGEAEVEFSRTAPVSQEVEFSVSGAAPNATLTFSIDGVEVGTATADARGHAEMERDVRMPSGPQR